MPHLAHVALLVAEYDSAIAWFTTTLGFTLREDSPREHGKRWVRVGPVGGGTELLLARAANDEQRAAIGRHAGGRVGFFLHTDDFARDHAAFTARGVQFVEAPRHEAYGTVAVFEDLHGNRWDLIEKLDAHPTEHAIEQELPINAPPERVFAGVATPAGLDCWWTLTCAGTPELGATYALGFGAEYQWTARVSACVASRLFEFTMTASDADWRRSRVRFELVPSPNGTTLRFSHVGWPQKNTHYRVSSHCWALYLRLLRRYVETGEVVPFDDRLSV